MARELICENCGKVFQRENRHVLKHVFCSRQCAFEYRVKRGEIPALVAAGVRARLAKVKGEFVKCIGCTQEIYRSPAQVEKFKNRLCIECLRARRAHRRQAKQQAKQRSNRGVFEYVCINCLGKFQSNAHKERKRKYCSRKCRSEYLARNRGAGFLKTGALKDERTQEWRSRKSIEQKNLWANLDPKEREIRIAKFLSNRSSTSRLGIEGEDTAKAIRLPTIRDLEWIAGFLEGEGSFGYNSGSGQVGVSQVNLEPLTRLLNLLGGNIYPVKLNNKNPNWNDAYAWHITGSRARGVMMTVYPLMTEKRKHQILLALKSKKET